MCGRFYIASEDMDRVITRLLHGLPANENIKTGGEIFPGDTAPVIAPNRSRETRAFGMDWGFSLGKGKRLINARSETAHAKPLFRDSLQNRRCLIPASFYFEWGQEDKIKYLFHPQSGKGICMAGIYRPEENGRYAFTILTRDASPGIAHLHPRMPVILPIDAFSPWLDSQSDPATVLRRAHTDLAYAPAAQIPLDKSGTNGLY